MMQMLVFHFYISQFLSHVPSFHTAIPLSLSVGFLADETLAE